MSNLSTVKLYGNLAKKYGEEFQFAIKSVTEAVRALCANFKDFKKDLYEGQYYIFVDDINISDVEVFNPTRETSVIKIVPAVSGSGGFFRVILGAALIGAAFIPGVGPLAAAALKTVGTSLIFGGLSELLFAPNTSSVEDNERPENRPNYSFQGAVNTTAQGGAVPICYGRLIVGSAVISAGISTSDQ